MSNTKCPGCGLYNFAGVTECRRCMHPVVIHPAPQTLSYTQNFSGSGNLSPYPATPVQAEAAFSPPGSWMPATGFTIHKDAKSWSNHLPVLFMSCFLLTVMLIGAGIPPKLENIQYSILTFHIGMFLFTLIGIGKWVVSQIQAPEEPDYSGKIKGFLNLAATGMIVYIIMISWMSVECRLNVSRLADIHLSLTMQYSKTTGAPANSYQNIRLTAAKEFFQFAAPCFFFMALLSLIALTCFYFKERRTPIICIITMLFQILGWFLIALYGQAAQAYETALRPVRVAPTHAEDLSVFDYFLIFAGLCILFNLAAFILYFMISRRVKATFV